MITEANLFFITKRSYVVDGVRISVAEGVDEFLAPDGDPQGTDENLILLCRSEELKNRFGEAVLKNLQQFSFEKVMPKYLAVMQGVIGSMNPSL